MTDPSTVLSQIDFVDQLMLPAFGATTAMLKKANDYSYIIAIIANATQPLFSKKSLADITDEWDIKIAPAGWAFSIWGVIYTMLAGFVYYQSYPSGVYPGGID